MTKRPAPPGAQDPGGLGRRRPRMQARAQEQAENVKAWNRAEAPKVAHDVKTVGPHPRGPGVCPRCGREVERLAIHLRQCDART